MTRLAGIGWIAALGVLMTALAIIVAMGVLGNTQPAPEAGAEYDSEQLCNASTIIEVGSALGLSERDQTIAVMTAIGESGLRNLPYGDWETSGVRNPDGSPTTSIGLFQQQDEWGSREERLNPHTAATLFYRAMTERVPQPERDALEPTVVAHRTQVNDDPLHYATYWATSIGIVEMLTASEPVPDAAAAARQCG